MTTGTAGNDKEGVWERRSGIVEYGIPLFFVFGEESAGRAGYDRVG